jgi:hypothetical protein
MRRGTFHDHPNCKESLLDIAEHLRALELELLTNTTRKNAARVSSLLADTFREFGSSGRVYPKNDIIIALQEEAPVSISLMNFEMMLLSEGVALVTYQSQKDQQDAPPSTALRSSIWIQNGDDWRMIFHQGTKLS